MSYSLSSIPCSAVPCAKQKSPTASDIYLSPSNRRNEDVQTSVTQTHGSLEVWLEAFRVRAPDEQRRRALPQHDGVGKEHRVAEDIRAPQVEQPGDLVHELGKKTQRGKSSERTARKRKTAARRRNVSS